jgi:hypothetical protein
MREGKNEKKHTMDESKVLVSRTRIGEGGIVIDWQLVRTSASKWSVEADIVREKESNELISRLRCTCSHHKMRRLR